MAQATCPPTNPREVRALRALLQGPLRREELDRAAGASNSPDVVMRMRRALGIEVPCKKVQAVDRDGKRCRPGVFSLTDDDRAKVIGWLGAA